MFRTVPIILLVLGCVAGFSVFPGQADESPANPDAEKKPVAGGVPEVVPLPDAEADIPKGPPRPVVRFTAAMHTTRLPWLYRDLTFTRPQDTLVYRFSVNGLDVPPGNYRVALIPYGIQSSLIVSLDNRRYRKRAVRGGRIEIGPIPIRRRILSFYLKAEDVVGKSPLSTVYVYPTDMPFEQARKLAIPFGVYRRALLSLHCEETAEPPIEKSPDSGVDQGSP